MLKQETLQLDSKPRDRHQAEDTANLHATKGFCITVCLQLGIHLTTVKVLAQATSSSKRTVK